jgi:hypothetical protein
MVEEGKGIENWKEVELEKYIEIELLKLSNQSQLPQPSHLRYKSH